MRQAGRSGGRGSGRVTAHLCVCDTCCRVACLVQALLEQLTTDTRKAHSYLIIASSYRAAPAGSTPSLVILLGQTTRHCNTACLQGYCQVTQLRQHSGQQLCTARAAAAPPRQQVMPVLRQELQHTFNLIIVSRKTASSSRMTSHAGGEREWEYVSLHDSDTSASCRRMPLL